MFLIIIKQLNTLQLYVNGNYTSMILLLVLSLIHGRVNLMIFIQEFSYYQKLNISRVIIINFRTYLKRISLL